jgi:hypothetical protein
MTRICKYNSLQYNQKWSLAIPKHVPAYRHEIPGTIFKAMNTGNVLTVPSFPTGFFNTMLACVLFGFHRIVGSHRRCENIKTEFRSCEAHLIPNLNITIMFIQLYSITHSLSNDPNRPKLKANKNICCRKLQTVTMSKKKPLSMHSVVDSVAGDLRDMRTYVLYIS